MADNRGPTPGATNTAVTTQTPVTEVYGTPGDGKVVQWNATTGRLEWGAGSAASLPSMTGNAGKTLVTDGSAAAWGGASLLAPAPSGDTSGATDNTAIQALIDTATAGGDGGIVQLRAGTYYVTGLQMKPMVTLRGAGWRTVVRAAAGTANAVIGSPASGTLYGAEVSDLTVYGARASTTSDGINLTLSTAGQPQLTAVGLADAVNRVRNCAVLYAGRDGIVLGVGSIHVTGEGENMAQGCYVLGSGRYGMNLSGFDLNVWNCTVGASTQHGVVITANNIRVYNTKSWFAGRNYYPAGSIDTIGSGASSYDGFYIGQNLGGSNAIQLSGCQSQDNGRYGLNLDGVSGVKVSGHYFGGDAVAAFRLGNGAAFTLDGTVGQADRGATPVLGVCDGNGQGSQIKLHYDAGQAATNLFQYVNSGSLKGCDVAVYSSANGVNNVGNVSGAQTPNALLGNSFVYTFTGNGSIANARPAVPGQTLEFMVSAGANTISWGTDYHTLGGGALPTTGNFSIKFRNINTTTDTPYWVQIGATGP